MIGRVIPPDAAAAADVRHFVYTSVASSWAHTGLEHFDSKWLIEDHVRHLGIPYTILRPVWFMDNWGNPMFRDAILAGALHQPLSPDRPFQQIAVEDIGAFASLAFQDPDRWVGREIDLAGDDRSIADVARTFGQVVGRPVEYVQTPWDRFQEAAGDEYTKMYRWFEDVGYSADIPLLRRLYPGLQTFDQFLRRNGWVGANAPAPAGP